MEYNNFNPYRCNICFYLRRPQKTSSLKSCSDCMLISYCSVDHQRMDWKTHKSFCKQIKTILSVKKIGHILDFLPETNDIPKQTRVLRSMQQAVFYLSNFLKRSLTDWESTVCYNYSLIYGNIFFNSYNAYLNIFS